MIETLMKYETAGDPITGLKWTRKTTEKVTSELKALARQAKLGASCRVKVPVG